MQANFSKPEEQRVCRTHAKYERKALLNLLRGKVFEGMSQVIIACKAVGFGHDPKLVCDTPAGYAESAALVSTRIGGSYRLAVHIRTNGTTHVTMPAKDGEILTFPRSGKGSVAGDIADALVEARAKAKAKAAKAKADAEAAVADAKTPAAKAPAPDAAKPDLAALFAASLVRA